jgi:hypothetical protein
VRHDNHFGAILECMPNRDHHGQPMHDRIGDSSEYYIEVVQPYQPFEFGAVAVFPA